MKQTHTKNPKKAQQQQTTLLHCCESSAKLNSSFGQTYCTKVTAF